MLLPECDPESEEEYEETVMTDREVVGCIVSIITCVLVVTIFAWILYQQGR